MHILLSLMNRYGILSMFFLILLEYACFPVSSEIVLPFSGAVASMGNTPFLLMDVLSVLAGLLGTSICYGIGRMGGIPLLHKIIKRFPKTEKGITSSMERFHKYGTAAVCAGRLIPICRTYIAFIAGAASQPYPVFFSASFLGITIWNTALIGLGYLMGENWNSISLYYKEYKHILMIAAVCILLSFFLSRLLRKRKA